MPRLGWVKTFEELRFKGQVKSLVISYEGHRWYASIAVEVSELPAIASKNQGSVGVDLGALYLATLSNGERIPAPKPYKKLLKKLKRLQRQLSRKVKGSANRKKALAKLRRVHEKIANIREESLHQLSHMLTLRFNVIGIEDLNVSGMLKNHCLAGTIADLGFYELRRQLVYKAKYRKVWLEIADRWFPSSKLCSECKVKNDRLLLSMREWTCESCGVTHDRDINAAVNLEIYAVSSTVSACGEESSGRPRKRATKLASTKQELNIDLREQI